jgi:murein DD-endopeptidase MepM/ murein hydrolase activator NlpD
MLGAVGIVGCSSSSPDDVAAPLTLASSGSATTTTLTISPVTMATDTISLVSATTDTTIEFAPTTSVAVVVSAAKVPTGFAYAMPVDALLASYSPKHHDYPASDIFVACAAPVISPIDATVLEVRRADGWSQDVDNPATRGGKSVSLLGDDGVRYYFAHFETISEPLAPGHRITRGTALGAIGSTGRAGACHVHFALSPPCPGKEWSVRRGVIWPWPYLDDWRSGGQRSPAAEIQLWLQDNPDACAQAMTDPNAGDS